MNSKTFISLAILAALVLALLAGLPGCSTSKTASEDQSASRAALLAEAEWRNVQLIPRPPAMEPRGMICHLGTTCLEMDPRPFEPCLLSTKLCGDKASEPIQVAPPWTAPAAPDTILVRSEE
jgi:hypothetical protein